MSWHCPVCDTVNSDAVPVCTVCDHLAPVIESYLALEQIEDLREYNDKMELVHKSEEKGDYKGMLKAAMEAAAVYKENDLAIEKAECAIKNIEVCKISDKLFDIIKKTAEAKDFLAASKALTVWDKLKLDKERVKSLMGIIDEGSMAETNIKKCINSATDAILSLKAQEALNLIDESLLTYIDDSRLISIRDKIQTFITKSVHKKESQRKNKETKPVIKDTFFDSEFDSKRIKDSEAKIRINNDFDF